MDDFASKLIAAMEERKIYIKGSIDWSSRDFQRFADATGRKRGKALFVILYDGGATFGSWRNQDDWCKWWFKSIGEITNDERKQIEENRKRALREKTILLNDAIYRSKIIWDEYCHDEINHQYVTDKCIIPYYAKQCRSRLVIPIRDIDYKLVSLQSIKPNGFKQFKKHTSFKNNMVWLCDEELPPNTNFIRVCEGWATGCTIKEAIGGVVVCAMAAGNLMNVCIQLKKKYKHIGLKICADNDQWRGKDENTGVNYACHAALMTGAIIYCPDFSKFDVSGNPTDFNDLLKLSNINEVKRQLICIR